MLDRSYGFQEFPKSSKEDWLEKLIKDIGDEKAEHIQRFKLSKDIQIGAYKSLIDSTPIKINTEKSWTYIQPVSLRGDQSKINDEVLEALNNGAGGVFLDDIDQADLSKSLKSVDPQYCIIGIHARDLEKYNRWLESHNHDISRCQLLIKPEPIAGQAITNIGRSILIAKPEGFDPVSELAHGLSSFVAVLNDRIDNDRLVNELSDSVWFETNLTSSYFLEISKLRAMRLLVSAVMKEYGMADAPIHIHANCQNEDSKNVNESNYLHCTTQAMAAIAGGVDSISIYPNVENPNGPRIARNISNLLRDESQFDKVADPAAGSYYIDHLTDELARKAWESFVHIESNGGIKWAESTNYFQTELAENNESTINNLPAN